MTLSEFVRETAKELVMYGEFAPNEAARVAMELGEALVKGGYLDEE